MGESAARIGPVVRMVSGPEFATACAERVYQDRRLPDTAAASSIKIGA
jgi:hypothetical protein